jgi:hypothetical protein
MAYVLWLMPPPVQLSFTSLPISSKRDSPPPDLPQGIRPTKVFDSYWRFAAERQDIFFRRLSQGLRPWTNDSILHQFKFTNAYRASDRVSQYLIRRVLYEGDQSAEEVFFRTLVFKVFNRIETWELLANENGVPSLRSYDFDRYDRTLTGAMSRSVRIYSAAYIMPSGGRTGEQRKHRSHLRLIEQMLAAGVPSRLRRSVSMEEGFEILKSYPMIGDFLAYQFITDLNYSTLTNYSEMEFVVPGPGAKDGISKCFLDAKGLVYSEIIRMMADRQEKEFARLGLSFKSLWGRRLQLIDCQNLFCEVDKYARVAHPDVMGLTGRTRIKQKYRENRRPVEYWYPPKWGINSQMETLKLDEVS